MAFISQKTVEEVRDRASITEVVGEFLKLKRAGANFTSSCPFHQEKSASFSVNPARNIYKCFGCGVAGDSIQFVMEHEKKDFNETITWLAEFYKIPLNYEDQAPRKQEDIDLEKQMFEALRGAQIHYSRILHDLPADHAVKKELFINRLLTEEEQAEWGIGYSPEENFLANRVKKYWTAAEKAGLVKTFQDHNVDVFKGRIMFPIHDLKGRVVGFGGRTLSNKKEVPKYLNTGETPLYNKSKVLYGGFQARNAIIKARFAYVVEGYYDVVQMHSLGIKNTVAASGTSLTIEHITTLKKWCTHLVFLFDSDAAGIKAAMRSIDLALAKGLKVELATLPEGDDPDSLIRVYKEIPGINPSQAIQAHLAKCKVDGVVWKAERLTERFETPDERAESIHNVIKMLALIEDKVKRNEYIKLLTPKNGKIDRKTLETGVSEYLFELKAEQRKNEIPEDIVHLPKGINRDEFFADGFYSIVDGLRTGFHFLKGNGQVEQLTNFTLEPLFHIYSRNAGENKRMVQINNGLYTRVLELESGELISVESFAKRMYGEGNFLPMGAFGKPHLYKILNKISDKFPICYELKTLGWQGEGFFAWSNCIFTGEIFQYNELGIATHNEKNYYSPSASSIQSLVRLENDEYENDRYLTYIEPPFGFEEWCRKMLKAYPGKAELGIAFVFITLFRDLFFRLGGNCPNLYAYGQAASGKSKFGESISNLFFKDMSAFNLNQGTDFAFFNRLERFRNCPAVLNEFDEEAVKENWFRAIKAAYDGEGRERGKGGNKNKTEVQKINSTLLLLGQYLSTKDDGAVLMRCVIITFEQNNERSEEQTAAFADLKEFEQKGLGGILPEILAHRPLFQRELPEAYADIKKRLKEQIKQEGKNYKDRIVDNYTAFAAAVAVASKVFKLGFTAEEFFTLCKNEIVRLSNIIAESNALADFWKTVEFLLSRELILEGFDFKIETHQKLEIKGDGKKETVEFPVPTKLIFFRLSNIHKQYLQAARQQKGANGLNEQTLLLYMKAEKSYVGLNPASRFRDTKGSMTTSSYVFRYDELGVNLERFDDTSDRTKVTLKGSLRGKPSIEEQYGKMVVKFQLASDGEVQVAGQPVSKELFTNCYSSNTEHEHWLKINNKNITVIGMLAVKEWNAPGGEKRSSRNLDVISLETSEGTEEAATVTTTDQDDLPF